MEVFISWSGPRSERTALILEKWLRRTIQACKPWMSTKIEKGARWSPEVACRLEQSKVGVVCLTQENLEAPWILFEAGAIAKVSGSRLCPFLLDVKKTDVKPPLGEFQATAFDRTDLFDLLTMVNSKVDECGETSLPDIDLREEFNHRWPELEKDLQAVAAEKPAAREELRPERELMEETLETVRGMSSQLLSLIESLSGPANFAEFLQPGTKMKWAPKQHLLNEEYISKVNSMLEEVRDQKGTKVFSTTRKLSNQSRPTIGEKVEAFLRELRQHSPTVDEKVEAFLRDLKQPKLPDEDK